MSVVKVSNLHVAYQEKPVLWNVHFEVQAGQNYAIIGPNGAGKTTLLKSLLHELKPSLGEVLFFDENINNVRDKIAYVPQRQNVDWDFPINVLDVVLMGLYAPRGVFARIHKSDKQKALQALEMVGMADFAKRQISKLSGGQQQRVFIARALVSNAELLIMDEPFAGVDMQTEKMIVQILKDLKAAGKTTLCVHHDLTTIPDYFDRVIMINGRLIVEGEVKDVFTQEFLSQTFGGKLPVLENVVHKSHSK